MTGLHPRRMGDGMTVLKSNGRLEYWVWRHGRLVRVPSAFERAA